MTFTGVVKEDAALPAMPVDLKHENRYMVLQVFKLGLECTVADVSAVTGISKLTVMRAIQFFCKKGVLRSVGLGHSSDVGGKKPEYFAIAETRKVLTISLWPGCIRLNMLSLTGQTELSQSYPFDTTRPLRDIFNFIDDQLTLLQQKNLLDRESLYGALLSITGTVDAKRLRLRYSAFSPQWGADVDLGKYLYTLFPTNTVVKVESAGKTTGRSILLLSPELNDKYVLTLYTGFGVSGCVIKSGEAIDGKNALIGEIGHMTVEPYDDEICGCGKHGCLERLVSIERVRQKVQANPPPAESPLSAIPASHIQFADIFSASRQEDSYAREIVRYLAGCFATALHNIALASDPDCVVFQGDFGHADDYFDLSLKKMLSSFRYYPREGAFETRYDDRDLYDSDVQGGWQILNAAYFNHNALYVDG